MALDSFPQCPRAFRCRPNSFVSQVPMCQLIDQQQPATWNGDWGQSRAHEVRGPQSDQGVEAVVSFPVLGA